MIPEIIFSRSFRVFFVEVALQFLLVVEVLEALEEEALNPFPEVRQLDVFVHFRLGGALEVAHFALAPCNLSSLKLDLGEEPRPVPHLQPFDVFVHLARVPLLQGVAGEDGVAVRARKTLQVHLHHLHHLTKTRRRI